jgi:deoxycytidylate deaminase
MKSKHVQIRINQCLELARASGCPRRKLGALLLDPKRNVILADGYNGGPRGAEGSLCKGFYCERDGLTMDDFEFRDGSDHEYIGRLHKTVPVVRILMKGTENVLKVVRKEMFDGKTLGPFDFTGSKTGDDDPLGLGVFRCHNCDWKGAVPSYEGLIPGDRCCPECGNAVDQKVHAKVFPTTLERAQDWAQELVDKTPPIKSGTMMERGCHHAEMNVICNAAATNVSCQGAWMIVLAEPCVMCAKLIHHSGIAKVIVVDGGYLGGKAGVEYLRANGVRVDEVEGPKDPRMSE